MVEKRITASDNVVELAAYQRGRNGVMAAYALSPRNCRFCGAELGEDESEEDCSSTLNFNADSAKLRWRAAQILRTLV